MTERTDYETLRVGSVTERTKYETNSRKTESSEDAQFYNPGNQ